MTWRSKINLSKSPLCRSVYLLRTSGSAAVQSSPTWMRKLFFYYPLDSRSDASFVHLEKGFWCRRNMCIQGRWCTVLRNEDLYVQEGKCCGSWGHAYKITCRENSVCCDRGYGPSVISYINGRWCKVCKHASWCTKSYTGGREYTLQNDISSFHPFSF